MEDIGVEKRSILRDYANGFSQRGKFDGLDVLSVDEDTARVGVVESEEQAEDGRFATA
jgi:hypothetical protein